MLLATAVYLTTRAVDDALDLLEVLIATKLLAHAERETAKEKLETLPRATLPPGAAVDRGHFLESLMAAPHEPGLVSAGQRLVEATNKRQIR